MSKLGISLNIDVTRLNKSKLYKGAKGTYAKLTVFIDPNETDQYGNHGGITEEQTKEEQAAKAKKNYVGNAKVFWTDTTEQARNEGSQQQAATQQAPAGTQDFEDSIPF